MRQMLTAIVRRGQSRSVMEAARRVGAPGGTIFYARGTASSTILAALGLGDGYKDVLVSFMDEEVLDRAIREIRGGHAKGMLLASPCIEGDEEVPMDCKWRLVEVICEEGYSEDIMAVARKAGAKGGTVVNAHGTSTPDDVKFFGTPIVPEKEILMVVMEEEKADAVVKAIEGMEVLRQKGRAVMFTLPVSSFVNLS